ncbi:MAG: ABC transporter permease [Thermomicrobiales bacterium]|nr:ABC transporter permease [Thermomicrobiales bacterium]
MARYIIRRLIGLIPLLLGISFIVYALMNLVPGSPTSQFEMNPNIKPSDIARIQENLGLNEPWYTRYFIWLGNALKGDLGISYLNGQSVSRIITSAMPNTLALSIPSIIISVAFAIPVGVLGALKRNSLFDRVTTIFATIFYSTPTVFLGMMMIIIFGVKFQEWGLPNLPVAGTHNLRGGGDPWDRIVHLIMPVVTLSLVSLAGWTRYIRTQMLEVINQDYVRTAQSKGLKYRSVVMGHAFKNAMLPMVTLIGLSIPDIFGGALIVENVFGYRGMGQVQVEALQFSNYSVAMACVMFFAILTVLGNLIADILYGVLDPRVRLD